MNTQSRTITQDSKNKVTDIDQTGGDSITKKLGGYSPNRHAMRDGLVTHSPSRTTSVDREPFNPLVRSERLARLFQNRLRL